MTLKAIGAYDCLQKRHGDISKFCKDNFLRPKAMEEVMKLYRQLCHIMETKMNIKIGKLVPPDPQQEFYLRQIFLTGHADCVAKLDENHAATRGPNGQPVYETEWSNETEYFVIHPSSCISRVRPPPKFVIFDHIQAKQDVYAADNTVIDHRVDSGPQRKFLKIVTTIEVSWLTDQATIVNPGKLLELPQPCYKRKEDQVVGFISPTYGAKLWQLPVTEKILISKEGVPYFAQALLDGKVDICSNGNAFLTLNVL